MKVKFNVSTGSTVCKLDEKQKNLSGAASLTVSAVEVTTEFKYVVDVVLRKPKSGLLYTYGSSGDVITVRNPTYIAFEENEVSIHLKPDEYCSIWKIIHGVASNFILEDRYPPE